MNDDLCPNCNSSLHARCCSWCGGEHKPSRVEMQYCSRKCENEAARADKISAAAEREHQTVRLTEMTRRGIGTMRSLAQIAIETDTDLTGQQSTELGLAIAWLDQKLGGK